VPAEADRRSTLCERLRIARILPVLRLDDADEAGAATARCVEAGLDVIELTATTAGWPAALADARRRHPHPLIGVGTIMHPDQASVAMDGGADFLVSPCPVPEVRAVAGSVVPLIEGGMTVGEVVGAASRGIAKLFPAHVGGPQLLRSILAVAPGARIVPTGGIAVADVPRWIAAGAHAVGVGTDLLRRPDLAIAVAETRRLLSEGPAA